MLKEEPISRQKLLNVVTGSPGFVTTELLCFPVQDLSQALAKAVAESALSIKQRLNLFLDNIARIETLCAAARKESGDGQFRGYMENVENTVMFLRKELNYSLALMQKR